MATYTVSKLAADAGVSDATAEPADASAQYVPETAPVEREPVEPGERARQATVQSSELDTPSEQAVIEASPAQFNGVQPASTRLEELEKRWGMPAATTPLADGKRLRYQIAPFESVLVTIKNNVVDGIVVNLAQPIVAYLLDVLVLGLMPTPRHWAGLMVSLLGIFVAGMKSKQPSVAQEA